jgi:hypothetical protein
MRKSSPQMCSFSQAGQKLAKKLTKRWPKVGQKAGQKVAWSGPFRAWPGLLGPVTARLEPSHRPAAWFESRSVHFFFLDLFFGGVSVGCSLHCVFFWMEGGEKREKKGFFFRNKGNPMRVERDSPHRVHSSPEVASFRAEIWCSFDGRALRVL